MRRILLLSTLLASPALAQTPTFQSLTITAAPTTANQVPRLSDVTSRINLALPSMPACTLAGGTGAAGVVAPITLDPAVFSCANGVLTLNGVTPTAATSVPALASLQLLGANGLYYTGTQLQPLFGGAAPVAATAATLSGLPTSGVTGTALPAASVTLTPTGSTAYAVLALAGVDEGTRQAFTGGSTPSLVPASNGSYTENIYAAATGGTALAISPAIAVAAQTITATSATIAGAPATGNTGVPITGLTAALSPAGATGYVQLFVGGVAEGTRAAFTGQSVPSRTPAATGSYTEQLFAAASGGSALATSGTITVSASATLVGGATPVPAGSTLLFKIDTANPAGQFYSAADGGGSAVASGGGVVSIKEMSSNHYVFNSPAAVPLTAGYVASGSANGAAALIFDGSTGVMDLASGSLPLAAAMKACNGLTMYGVMTPTNTNNVYVFGSGEKAQTNNYGTNGISQNYPNDHAFGVQRSTATTANNSFQYTDQNGGPNPLAGNPLAFVYRYNTGGATAIALRAATVHEYNTGTASGTDSTTPWDHFTVGGLYYNGGRRMSPMKLAEFGAFCGTAAATDAEVAAILDTYIPAKWGGF